MGAYEDMLARRAVNVRPELSGGSGYFAARGTTLDPSLFHSGDHLIPEVRRLILSQLYGFLERRYPHPQVWTEVWIAGSGITSAWNASRESNGAPGDLDCLLGLDYARLRSLVRALGGSSDQAIARYLNQQMHDELWPHTEATHIGASVYEVTYYVNNNVGIGQDALLTINPYAAYNVTHDVWTVHPVEVPGDFGDHYFSAEDRRVAHEDYVTAAALQHQLIDLQQRLRDASPAEHVNLLPQLHDLVRAGAEAFDSIHKGRREAFTPGGKGYFDAANYRWQAGKGSGAINVLRQLKQLDEAAHRDLAHGRCTDVDHLLTMGALANGGR
jgi:hypothetical protein